MREKGNIWHDVLYVLPAALLGVFMGSEAFKEPWHIIGGTSVPNLTIGSEQGWSIGGFYVITGIIFGAVVVALAAAAARVPATGAETPSTGKGVRAKS
jgi:hypothetical protein